MTPRRFALYAAAVTLLALFVREWFVLTMTVPNPTQGDVSAYLRYAIPYRSAEILLAVSAMAWLWRQMYQPGLNPDGTAPLNAVAPKLATAADGLS